ncbi:hypothetical protein LTR92_010788 [Exophiala xenobiotica]|nr:hypothetical protein LTR92_010788 [Exophiala xenobiotica]
MSSFTRQAPESMEDSFFDPNLFGLEQPAGSPPVTPTVFPEHADLSQGRLQSNLNHGWPNTTAWEPSRRAAKEPRRAAAQQHNTSTALPPSGSKSGHLLVKQFLNVAQRARSTADEHLEELEQRQTRQIEELRKRVDQCCHSISRIESKLAELQKALQESEKGSEMMMQVAQAASVALNSIMGTTVPSNTAE